MEKNETAHCDADRSRLLALSAELTRTTSYAVTTVTAAAAAAAAVHCVSLRSWRALHGALTLLRQIEHGQTLTTAFLPLL